MLYYGEPPYLECSSKGDTRFSSFYAIVNGKSIEEQYQAAKIFEDGTTGLTWKEAKGRKAINQEDCAKLFENLWRTYIEYNPELLPVIIKASGLSDIFGQKGHQCQAEVLWKIRNEYVSKLERIEEAIQKVLDNNLFGRLPDSNNLTNLKKQILNIFKNDDINISEFDFDITSEEDTIKIIPKNLYTFIILCSGTIPFCKVPKEGSYILKDGTVLEYSHDKGALVYPKKPLDFISLKVTLK